MPAPKAPPVPRRASQKSKGRGATGDPSETVPPVPPVDTDPFTGTTPPESDSAPEPGPAAPKAREARPGGRKPALQKSLEELFATPALAYSFAGDAWAAELIATRTEAMAEAWYELGQKNAAVKRILNRLVEGSAWGGVLMSTAAVLVPLAQHHGIVPGVDPFALFYPPLPTDGQAGPIVPPPPSSAAAPVAGGGGTVPRGDTESVPGAVTVAQNGTGGGSN